MTVTEKKIETRPKRVAGQKIDTAADIYKRLKGIGKLEQEEFWCLNLNSKNRIISEWMVSRGTLTASLVHPRDVFREAVRVNAHSIIVAHNHPSGDLTPSPEDHDITKRLIEAGILLGIRVLDHAVITEDEYYSFHAQHPQMFSKQLTIADLISPM